MRYTVNAKSWVATGAEQEVMLTPTVHQTLLTGGVFLRENVRRMQPGNGIQSTAFHGIAIRYRRGLAMVTRNTGQRWLATEEYRLAALPLLVLLSFGGREVITRPIQMDATDMLQLSNKSIVLPI